MNNKIITIATIVFALIFVVILAVMMGTITTKSNSANSKLTDTLEMSDNASLDVYATGTVIKGEAVINAIKNVKSIGGNLKLKIGVMTPMDTAGVGYGYNVFSSSNSDIISYNITDSSHKDYINQSASFKCMIVRNENNVVVGILFEQTDIAEDDKVDSGDELSKLKGISMA